MTAHACYLTPKPTHDARVPPECPPPPGPAPHEPIDLDLDLRSFPWLAFPRDAFQPSPASPGVPKLKPRPSRHCARPIRPVPTRAPRLKPRPSKHVKPSRPALTESSSEARPASPTPSKAGLGSLTRSSSFQRALELGRRGSAGLIRCPSFSRLA